MRAVEEREGQGRSGSVVIERESEREARMQMSAEGAKRYEAYRSVDEIAGYVSQLFGRYLGVQRWYVVRRQGAAWLGIDAVNRARIELAQAQVFVTAMMRAMALESAYVNALVTAALEDNEKARLARGGGDDGCGFIVGVPLMRRQRVDGFVCGLTPVAVNRDLPEHEMLITVLVRLLNTLVERDVQVQSLRRQVDRANARTLHDVLTGVLNRRGWDMLLKKEEQRMARYGHAATLFVCDLDGFKIINDRLGHEAGDDILRRVGRLLINVTREIDVVARLGGDEFGILAIESNEAAGAALECRLAKAFDEAKVRASIGRAQVGADGIAEAWQEADRVMYRAKRRRAQEKGALEA